MDTQFRICEECGVKMPLINRHVCSKRITDDQVHDLDGMARKSADMLEDIMLHQLDFMAEIGVPSLTKIENHIQHNDECKMLTNFTLTCATALGCEITELLDALPWKPWKKTHKEVDMNNVQIEIVDMLMFVLEIAAIWGMDAKKLHTLFLKKMQENFDRQKRGY